MDYCNDCSAVHVTWGDGEFVLHDSAVCSRGTQIINTLQAEIEELEDD